MRTGMSKTSKKLLSVLAGRAEWPPPIWLMRQAGRYLPEYRAVRAQVKDFVALCTTPALAAEVTLQPIRRYGFDAAILFSDILILPWALGHGLEFRAGEGPVMPPLRDAAGVSALRPDRVPGAVAPVLETVRRARAGLADEGFAQAALIGFAGAPFTVACYMVEGGGSRDFAATRGLAYRDPALFASLLDVLVEASVAYLAGQAEAGAEALMLFDTWAGLLPPAQFRSHVIAPTRRIVAALRDRCPGVPVIGFPRLAGLLLAAYAKETGVDGVGVDTSADMSLATRQVPGRIALQGNLDPLAVVAGGAAMRGQARAILDAVRGRPLVFNLGHGIVPETPPEHVAELVRQVRSG
jgi:uroporphyrinogen decarboxylase